MLFREKKGRYPFMKPRELVAGSTEDSSDHGVVEINVGDEKRDTAPRTHIDV